MTETMCGSIRSQKQGEQLLPGLPDEITLDLITPKLCWRDVPLLMSISRAWRCAVQSHQVYEARIRSRATAKLVIMSHIYYRSSEQMHGIALYSMRQKYCFELPPISALHGGLPYSCQCVSVDGSIYALGGAKDPSDNLGIAEVYVLDLAGGKSQWKQCASMQQPRLNFGCGVLDGKIYVFAGESADQPVIGSEVYDPKIDTWFPIKPIPLMRVHHQVAAMGGELVVHGGGFYEEVVEGEPGIRHVIQEAMFVDIYNPTTDEWRRIEPFKRSIGEGVFVAQGTLHLINQSGIHIYDVEDKSWTLLHSCSFLNIGSVEYVGTRTLGAVVLDDELCWRFRWQVIGGVTRGSGLLRSSGCGGENATIFWETARCSLSFELPSSPLSFPHSCFLSPIEL